MASTCIAMTSHPSHKSRMDLKVLEKPQNTFLIVLWVVSRWEDALRSIQIRVSYTCNANCSESRWTVARGWKNTKKSLPKVHMMLSERAVGLEPSFSTGNGRTFDTFIRGAKSHHIWRAGCTLSSFPLKSGKRSSAEDRGALLDQVPPKGKWKGSYRGSRWEKGTYIDRLLYATAGVCYLRPLHLHTNAYFQIIVPTACSIK